jgi:Family of unknown function (DUF6502)
LKRIERNEDFLLDFLAELARYLLQSGYSISEFQDIARRAYIFAAVESTRLSNLRVNQSAVAALTGLNRAQVRIVLGQSRKSDNNHQNRLERIVEGWRTDPQFIDQFGAPRVLPISKARSSFAALALKYGRDVSHRTLLAELSRQGLVSLKANQVTLRSGEGRARSPDDRIQALAKGLVGAISGVPNATRHNVHALVDSTTFGNLSPKNRLLFRKRLLQGLKAFTLDLKSAGDSLSTQNAKKNATSGTRTNILVVTTD